MGTSEHPEARHEHPHHPQADLRPDGHVHLHVTKAAAHAQSAWDSAHWAVVLLGASGAGLVVASFFFDWWRFWLYAPQYPGGLKLAISLTGVSGDVREVDILNHYIGMKSLSTAAPLERKIASFGVAAVATVSLAGALFAGRKIGKLIAIPAVLFPLIFIADSFYWLHRFGHDLDPRAPLKIGVFTPQMFGNGEIGQFATFAAPAMGFWIAIAGFVVLALGTLVRRKVCEGCGRASSCNVACPRAMVLSDRKPT